MSRSFARRFNLLFAVAAIIALLGVCQLDPRKTFAASFTVNIQVNDVNGYPFPYTNFVQGQSYKFSAVASVGVTNLELDMRSSAWTPAQDWWVQSNGAGTVSCTGTDTPHLSCTASGGGLIYEIGLETLQATNLTTTGSAAARARLGTETATDGLSYTIYVQGYRFTFNGPTAVHQGQWSPWDVTGAWDGEPSKVLRVELYMPQNGAGTAGLQLGDMYYYTWNGTLTYCGINAAHSYGACAITDSYPLADKTIYADIYALTPVNGVCGSVEAVTAKLFSVTDNAYVPGGTRTINVNHYCV